MPGNSGSLSSLSWALGSPEKRTFDDTPSLCRFRQRNPVVHVELKEAIRVHMAINQRRERLAITVGEFVQAAWLLEDSLDHRHLEEVKRQNRRLLIAETVTRDLSALSEKDERVGAVPVLDDVQSRIRACSIS